MLEEAGIEIFIESFDEWNFGCSPHDFVGEADLRVRLNLNFGFGRQIDIDDLIAMIADLELLVCPNVGGFA